MADLYEPGEFSLTDKLLPTDHRQARLAVLQKLYGMDPGLAREVISYAWPHERNRPYTDEELRQRLAIQEAAAKSTKMGSELFNDLFPSVTAAYDAFEVERARQAALEAQNYPALNFTQPMMASYALGPTPSDQSTAQPVHHRRHYHRHHKTAQYFDHDIEVDTSLPHGEIAHRVHGFNEFGEPMVQLRMHPEYLRSFEGNDLERATRKYFDAKGSTIQKELVAYQQKHAETEGERVKRVWDTIQESEKEKIREQARKLLVPSQSPSLDEALSARLLARSPVQHHIGDEWNVASGGAWSRKDNKVYFSPEAVKDPSVVAHELGHEQVEHTPGKWTQHDALGLARVSGLFAGGYLTAFLPTRKARLLAPFLITAATQGPGLYSEHKAWDFGRKSFQDNEATPEQMAAFEATRRNALGTYHNIAGLTLGTNLLGAVMREGFDAYRRKYMAPHR